MTWRSRSLLVLSIAFLLLLPPDGAWARGRGHERGHHHPSHHHFFGFDHPYGYAPCGWGSAAGWGRTLVLGSRRSPPPARHRPRGPPAEMPPKVEPEPSQ